MCRVEPNPRTRRSNAARHEAGLSLVGGMGKRPKPMRAPCASISAPVTCPNKRYSVLRGCSAASCALWYAFTAIDKPFLFKIEKGSALDQRLVIGAAHHIAADLHAGPQRLALADRIHE